MECHSGNHKEKNIYHIHWNYPSEIKIPPKRNFRPEILVAEYYQTIKGELI